VEAAEKKTEKNQKGFVCAESFNHWEWYFI
jgi:hypothetical protein